MIDSFSRQGRNAGLFALVLITCAAAAGPRSAPPPAGESPDAVTKTWPAASRSMSRLLIEKYGAPNQFDRDALVWFNNGEWKRTIIRRQAPRGPGAAPADFLEQTIGYLVPSDRIEELKRFSPKIVVSQTAGELTFASESEAKNRLALNLADEIVTGSRTAADARAFFKKTARLAASGKSSSYLEELRFEVDNVRYMTPTGADQ